MSTKTSNSLKHLPVVWFAAALVLAAAFVGSAFAADNLPRGRTASPIVDGQYPASYFPNTEVLGANEMRLTALGTGMPNQTKKAVSISYLVELGNGDKFLFDMGMGSMGNLFSLRPDFSKLDKVFASHLHIDHVGDFMGLHIGGWLSGRYTPIHIYGPTGSSPELGTRAFIEGMKKGYAWDLQTRTGALPDKGAQIVVHEFDYKQENKVVYRKNGVTIRSWPAIHSLDGSVSYSLEWNGLKYVFGGDTYPNKWYIKYAKDADIAIHEAFMTPELLVKLYNQAPETAIGVGTYVHTSPQAFGKVMSTIKPRHAIAYHFFNEADTLPDMASAIRETYDGPLTMAEDNLVWNITKDSIRVRNSVSDDEAWSVQGPQKPPKPDHTVPDQLTKWSLEHRWNDIDAVQGDMIKAFKKKYNLKDDRK